MAVRAAAAFEWRLLRQAISTLHPFPKDIGLNLSPCNVHPCFVSLTIWVLCGNLVRSDGDPRHPKRTMPPAKTPADRTSVGGTEPTLPGCGWASAFDGKAVISLDQSLVSN